MIITKAPGKLFIAGEYAVIEPGNPAILVAVNQFITATLEKSMNEGSISIYNENPILWFRENGKIKLVKHDERLIYVLTAINIVEKYARELGRNLSCYHLKIHSDLDNQDGIKYGLGSSAAVIVATVEALCNYYDINISKEKLFKLSALTNIKINKDSSCGDIAACVYGGWIGYTAFDRDWVLNRQISISTSQLLNLEWSGLYMQPLIPPKELRLVVGWTGLPSSTKNLVRKVNTRRLANSSVYSKFLMDSKKCVNNMINAFKDNNIEEIQKQIEKNREILVSMGNCLGVEIETPKLKKLCDTALSYNGYAKSSGAGGGDCGIAVFKDNDNINKVIQEWHMWGITYLPLKVYYKKGD